MLGAQLRHMQRAGTPAPPLLGVYMEADFVRRLLVDMTRVFRGGLSSRSIV